MLFCSLTLAHCKNCSVCSFRIRRVAGHLRIYEGGIAISLPWKDSSAWKSAIVHRLFPPHEVFDFPDLHNSATMFGIFADLLS